MKLKELTRQNFRSVVGADKIVLISCWAPGCGVCAQFEPVFNEVAKRHSKHVFARMNVMTDEKLGEFFGIDHTPALMVYRDSLLLLKKPGVFSKESLADIISQTESLDMDVVRADLESEGDESEQS